MVRQKQTDKQPEDTETIAYVVPAGTNGLLSVPKLLGN